MGKKKTTSPIQKVLMANRGEIAVRVIKTLRAMGIATVAVYSDADAQACHVRHADEAHALGGQAPADTYLNIDKLLAIAQASGCDAIHPGYGFLSENAAFARACQSAGVTFIGPTPTVIEQMGDKLLSKQLMQAAGVPVVPSWQGDVSDLKAAQKAVVDLGLPVLVKAAAGGGGKGMRLIESIDDLAAGLAAASREAQKAFGDARVFVEKFIVGPRHIEFQVFGDTHGNVVHLFERDCSIQRRHQKIIEESPSPKLDATLRQAMAQAAVAAASAVGYTNAGTVEFIVGQDGGFYFLEMNTRLQVEHPVTELVTGQDLVEWQVRVARGEALPLSQDAITQRGHALECRVYAEDPAQNFMPSTGPLLVYQAPTGPNVRLDSGVEAGDEVTVHYDPMLAKLITYGATRQAALDAMAEALKTYPVLGVVTNHALLLAILRHPEFVAGTFDTGFLSTHPPTDLLADQTASDGLPWETVLAGVLSRQFATSSASRIGAVAGPASAGASTVWQEVGPWRNN
ncbi:MAG: acetyl-CoA carboxylase biotin carboxylase subunit [Cyanobacteria bacterium HKST-UBA04]|nr:acetyl-CoA carboxylase biotin carboxylase subunit [Cyanobacteria bacterium HKST-UBA04]